MGSESAVLPCFDFSKGGWGLEEGGEGWEEMCKRVREACESHGTFLLVCGDETLEGLSSEKVFKVVKELFDLPSETKQKFTNPKPTRPYRKTPVHENFGIGVDDVPLPTMIEELTNLMWPQGNSSFCETIKSLGAKMLGLNALILKMIVAAYGLPQHYNSDVEEMQKTSYLRLIKYVVPEDSSYDSNVALPSHRDKGVLTILCENDVRGLQVQSKTTGEWIEIKIPKEGFVVFVGDVLKAWSNGRLHAPSHRVMVSEERYSVGVFALPAMEMEIKAPHELVDEKVHPLCYRPFKYDEYHTHYLITLSDKSLEEFAGV
ncbi:hypothetical protein RIF29_40168 [Crotalaria pallida]|uniref:2-oxoglutarate-dependent dioxygenase DAO n=1 Tax=Crotalaria pallida TaxID=3830 RepID=A0AAN9HU28_CROPI